MKKVSTRRTFVGMDVHEDSIDVTVAEEGPQGEVRHFGTIAGDLEAVTKLVRRLRRQDRELLFVYEAGPVDSRSAASCAPRAWPATSSARR